MFAGRFIHIHAHLRRHVRSHQLHELCAVAVSRHVRTRHALPEVQTPRVGETHQGMSSHFLAKLTNYLVKTHFKTPKKCGKLVHE